ncbi:MAG: hypothetical protein RL685_4617 [Pseudomonadota bacterium]|jgi:hypothetical protein
MMPGISASSGSRQASGFGRWRLAFRLVGGLGLLALALGACIIEKREYSQQLSDCWDYCDALETNCTGFSRVYENRDTCMATCKLIGNDPGDEVAATANTLSCRLDKLSARRIESNECPLVGPGGNGACGSNCQALCALRSQLCSDADPGIGDGTQVIAECESDCAALYDRGDMDASGVDVGGDSVQCRLLHISRAALHPEQAAQHCQASQIRPTPGEDLTTAPCSDPPGMDKSLECEKYCKIVTTACTGQNRVYEDKAQCLETCRETMTPGEPGDQELDTIRCRRYHAYFSLDLPENHCLHASATGDGHCGKENCTGYCRVLQQACDSDFQREFGATTTAEGALSTCIEACLPVEGGRDGLTGFARDEFAVPASGLRYALDPPPTGNTLLCRSYSAVQALSTDAILEPMIKSRFCTAAFGGTGCL